MIFHKNIEKETIKVLIQENKRLKRENQRLNESLNKLQRFKDEYRNLIDELHHVQASYSEKIKEFNLLEKEYKKQLGKIIQKTNGSGDN